VIIESKPLLDPTLLEEVQEAETLIFVDASSEVQEEPVRWIPVKPDFNGWALDSHHLSPQVFLGLLKSLYQCTPSAWLVAVRGERFELAQQIHALARARAEVAAAQIADWVALQFKANDKKVSHG
jgi:Ni,Fe-hydrogenase maturation factor